MAGAVESTQADDADLETGPLRLCAVSRASRPPEELIRFVLGPDGSIVPDLARRLPGRGVWVDATRSAVAGFTKVDALLAGGKAIVLLHASDGAADGAGKLDSKFRALAPEAPAERPIFGELTSAEMSLALGRLNVVHAAASEGGASRRIVLEAGRLRRFRTGGD